ncbi:MAG: hypothetical protein NVSMB55_01150 [Mycobacteriales bacterium]
MASVTTPRLDLISLSPALVTALVGSDLDRARELADFPIQDDSFQADAHVLELRHAQLTANPAEEPWLLRAAVLRETATVVGKVGFHAPPAPDGSVEIGYRVTPRYHRQGLAIEMAVAMIRWAGAHGATSCIASVRPDNTPSLRLIAGLGFERTGEHIDEIDGLEWIFALALPALPSYQPPR